MNERLFGYSKDNIISLVRASLALLVGYKCICYIGNHEPFFQNNIYLILYPCLFATVLLLLGRQSCRSAFSILVLLSSYELWIETYSLGSSSCNMMLFFFVLSKNDKSYSYSDHRYTHPTKSSIILIFLLLSVVNLTAAFLHLSDPYWQDGTALYLISTNNFYTSFHESFLSLSQNNQTLYLLISSVLLWSQIFFQIGMLPLSFIRYGFLIVRIWGILFNILTLIFFEISMLPLFSLTFWTLTLYLPSDFKLEINYFLSFKSLKRHLTANIAISLFFLSCISLFLKSSGLNNHDDLNAKSYKEILSENKTEDFIFKLCKYIGLTVPNVFNTQDILSNKKWAVIYNVSGEKKELIPFIAPDGSRLSYHHNDIICYKASIPIRRSLLSNDLNQTIEHLVDVSLYDNRKHKDSRTKIYEFAFFEYSAEQTPKSPFRIKRVDLQSYP